MTRSVAIFCWDFAAGHTFISTRRPFLCDGDVRSWKQITRDRAAPMAFMIIGWKRGDYAFQPERHPSGTRTLSDPTQVSRSNQPNLYPATDRQRPSAPHPNLLPINHNLLPIKRLLPQSLRRTRPWSQPSTIAKAAKASSRRRRRRSRNLPRLRRTCRSRMPSRNIPRIRRPGPAASMALGAPTARRRR
jgi:hypothetical protein